MKTTTYQVERAPAGTNSWEQLAPVVEGEIDATTLFCAEQIKANASKPVRLRLVRTEREIIRAAAEPL